MIRLLLRLVVLAFGLYRRIEPSVMHDLHRENVNAEAQTARRDLGRLPHLHQAG